MMKPLFPLFASLTLGVVAGEVAAQAGPAALSLQVYNADAGSFHVNAVLVSGKTDAVLIDTGFTRADAYRIAAMVLDSRKTLKTIYISQADPDFYFGTGVLKTLFPDATLIASAATVKKIQATLPTKLQVWGPRLGANAPADVPVPVVMSGNTITLEGQTLEIRGLDDSLPQRSYVWIPSLKAIVGGVNVFAGLHAWTADTQTRAGAGRLEPEAGRDGGPSAGDRRSWPHAAGQKPGRFAACLHPVLPDPLRTGTGESAELRRADRGDEVGLSRTRA